jgi:hypothetical protein
MKERPILFSAAMVRAILSTTKTQTRRVLKQATGPSLSVGMSDDDSGVAELSWLWGDGPGYDVNETIKRVPCPYGQPGDRLWVREAWRVEALINNLAPREMVLSGASIVYEADNKPQPWQGKLRPSMFMPRAASRITLEVTGVRVQRLQEISEADAIAEGCEPIPFPGPWWQGYRRDEDGELHHQQTTGETPPDWMVEPKRMKPMAHLDRSARDAFRQVWLQINGLESWDANPWVWCVSFRRIDQ